MNLIIIQHEDFIDDRHVRLSGRRHEHLQNVLGATQGKVLQVGLLNGKKGCAVVRKVDSHSTTLKIELTEDPPQAFPLTLVLAMPRPKVFKRILHGVTALGIKKIFLVNTWHVDKSYWQSPILNSAALQEQCILGLEQSRDTILPIIDIQARFKPFVEDILPGIIANTCALVAHPKAGTPCPYKVQGQITLAIGPERGFTSYEISKFEEIGMETVHMGTRPLKVETAIPALLGRLSPE